jgi:methionyl aminopeptidase
MILLKKPSEMEYLMQSGKILSAVLHDLGKAAKEGVSLQFLNQRAIELCKKYEARPAFLGYQPEGAERPYPAAVCLSLNDVVVHGVPTSRTLKSGDLLKIDMGVSYKGFITDSALTVGIGKIPAAAKKLMAATKHALEKGISAAKKGKRLGDIGYEIERVAKKEGFFVLKELTGHGVGYEVHEDPIIYNFGDKHTGQEIKEGMVFAIEPMFSAGTERVEQQRDESYASDDGSLTAHFEHTVAIINNKTVVLTQ